MTYIYDESTVETELEKDNNWYKEHNDELNSLRESINTLLSKNNIKYIISLCTCFQNAELIDTFKAIPDIAYCIIAISITIYELELKCTNNIFLIGVNSIDAIISKINKYKFLLLNIEFNMSKDSALNNICNELINDNLSCVALIGLIKFSSVDGTFVFNEINNYLISMGYDSKHIELLKIQSQLSK